MTDPTPGERARTAMDGMFDLATIEFAITDQIRCAVNDAVEAERERSSELREALGWYENATAAEFESDTGIRAHNALCGDERGATSAAIRGGEGE